MQESRWLLVMTLTRPVGCAPCQPFSRYTQGITTVGNEKWGLLFEFVRLVKGVMPEIVSMENVPEIRRHAVFSEFVVALENLGYHVAHSEAYCPDYGVPQTRRRLVLLASLFGPIHLRQSSGSYRPTAPHCCGILDEESISVGPWATQGTN